MLMGDFNARKGLLSDSLGGSINDLQFLTNSTDLNSNPDSETFTKLHSLDQSDNSYGRSLVNLCISNKLSILNGRVKGDLLGKFTCYKPNRASIVNYAILSNALIKHVIYFSVLPLSSFSCHCPISFAIKTNVFHTDENFNDFLLPKPPHFKWDSEKIEMYKSFLNSEQTILKNEFILKYMNLSNLSYDSIDKAVAFLTEVLYDNAKKCFALKDIGLNVAQKGLKIKNGLIKIAKLLRKRS